MRIGRALTIERQLPARSAYGKLQLRLSIERLLPNRWAITASSPELDLGVERFETDSAILKIMKARCFSVAWAPETDIELEKPLDLNQIEFPN